MKYAYDEVGGRFVFMPATTSGVLTDWEFEPDDGNHQKLEIDAQLLCRDCPACGFASPANMWDTDDCPNCLENVNDNYDVEEWNKTCTLEWFLTPHPFWEILSPNGANPELDIID